MPTRREFLQTLTVAAVASTGWSAWGRSPGQPAWQLAPETGCFESLVGPDVIPHLLEAVRRGYPVFLDPALLGRGLRERREILIAARELGVTLGPAELAFRQAGAGLVSEYEAFLEACAAGLTGGRIVVGPTMMLRPGDRDWPASVKLARRLAEARSVPLFLEAWDDGRRGAALYDDAAAWVAAVDHPLLRLSFDTVRLAAAGRDVVADAHQWKTLIGHIETAGDSTLLAAVTDELGPPADANRACIGFRGDLVGLLETEQAAGEFLA